VVTAAGSEDSADPATRMQLTKLAVLFGEHGITDRDDRIWFCSDHAGRPVQSSKELTKGEAHRLISRLNRLEVGSLPRVLASRPGGQHR